MSSPTAKFASAIFASIVAATYRHGIAQRAGRSRKMSLRAERCASRGRSLVLSHRPRHQTPLLVHRRGEAKGSGARRKLRSRRPILPRHRTTPVRKLRSPTRAPNCRCRRRASSRKPAFSPRSERRRRPSMRSVRRATSPENGRCRCPRSVVASRWPELAGAAPRLARTIGGQFASHRASNPGSLAAACRGLGPACRSGRTFAKPSGSVQMLLIAILGALTLAGLLASAIFRFGGGRRTTRRTSGRSPRKLELGGPIALRCRTRRRRGIDAGTRFVARREPSPRTARGGRSERTDRANAVAAGAKRGDLSPAIFPAAGAGR